MSWARHYHSVLFRNHFHILRCVNSLHTSVVCPDFFEPHRKAGYQKLKPLTFREKIPLVLKGMKELKKEFMILKDEIKDSLHMDPPFVKPGDSEYVWKFDKPEVLDRWNVVADSYHNEGYSECDFRLNKFNKAVFSGVLDKRVPKDGKQYRAGYCNITSMRVRKSFRRESSYEWIPYTHLVMRVRGDGRSYMINLLTEGPYDLTWNDIFNYILYTRGGPYWQMVKIPFSKFFLSSKGKVQDKQSDVPLNHITNIGITCSDQAPGPFQLELDYIGILYDPTHTETYAYEMYKTPDYIAGY